MIYQWHLNSFLRKVWFLLSPGLEVHSIRVGKAGQPELEAADLIVSEVPETERRECWSPTPFLLPVYPDPVGWAPVATLLFADLKKKVIPPADLRGSDLPPGPLPCWNIFLTWQDLELTRRRASRHAYRKCVWLLFIKKTYDEYEWQLSMGRGSGYTTL